MCSQVALYSSGSNLAWIYKECYQVQQTWKRPPTLGSLPSWYFQSIITCLPPGDRDCRNHIYSERKYFHINLPYSNGTTSSGTFCITILSNCIYSMLSTAEKVPFPWKVTIVTWSTPTLTLESEGTSTNQEISVSFAEEPWTWQSRRSGGCQGLAAAATGWLSDTRDTRDSQGCQGHGSSQRLLRTQAPGQKRQEALRGCCPSSNGAQRLHRAPLLPVLTFL